MPIAISLSPQHKTQLWSHLLAGTEEHVAFGFAILSRSKTATTLAIRSVYLAMAEDMDTESSYHVSLTDTAQAAVIRRAWDTKTSLVEFHSHRFWQPAQFSSFDIEGLSEFVPHVWWRLRGQPYGAIVVAETTFDALVWLSTPTAPERLDRLSYGHHRESPTGLSFTSLHED